VRGRGVRYSSSKAHLSLAESSYKELLIPWCFNLKYSWAMWSVVSRGSLQAKRAVEASDRHQAVVPRNRSYEQGTLSVTSVTEKVYLT
jgi:aryl-alcohol dehydrogenase-like predicted oxidoreductase